MHPTRQDLDDYYGSRQGRLACQRLSARVLPIIRPGSTARLLGMGHTQPLLRHLAGREFERLVMLAPFGEWSDTAGTTTDPVPATIGDPTALPFAASVFDQALLLHALEFVDAATALDELWRVLAPAGEIVAVVPNRSGLWTHFESTPFGYGHPYSRSTLTGLLRAARFEPVEWTTLLGSAPLQGLRWLDRPLMKLLPGFGGVHLLRARKTDGLGLQRRRVARRAGPAAAAAAAAPRGVP
jgi:SAM-dependent methyltransferase